MEGSKDNWLPLESNPELINKYIKDLGFNTSQFALVDVLSTEEWSQNMVPQPCLAVFFLYPITSKQKEYRKGEAELIKENPQTVYFMKQYAGNACGTVAMFHAITNLAREYPDIIAKDSYLQKFIVETKDLTKEERGNYFKKDKELEKAHVSAVKEGTTAITSKVITHFITFVEVDGSLYEMDGNKEAPINHGPCKPFELLKKSSEAIKQFIERDPGELRFTIMALASANTQQNQGEFEEFQDFY